MTGPSSGPFYHGTASEFQPGDLTDPAQELGARHGDGRSYATTSPQAARDYGRHKAAALRAGYDIDAEPRAYEVEPTGPIEPDPTVDERFAAWRTHSPLRIIRDITTPEPEVEAGS